MRLVLVAVVDSFGGIHDVVDDDDYYYYYFLLFSSYIYNNYITYCLFVCWLLFVDDCSLSIDFSWLTDRREVGSQFLNSPHCPECCGFLLGFSTAFSIQNERKNMWWLHRGWQP